MRKAYHEAARRWHPDRFAGKPKADAERAEARMRRLNEAWEVLGDAQRRKTYDIELRRRSGGAGTGGADASSTSTGTRLGADDDGVIRIDPRLLDPSFLAARRNMQVDAISNRTSAVLRMAPFLGLMALLAAIFVFTAYARNQSGQNDPTATTVPGPALGTGIDAGDCVRVLTGPSLLEQPCGPTADGRVIGARMPDGFCVAGTIREVVLANGAIACLGSAG